ncbi:MAG: MerR family transcriptional regulator [Pseudomonadota bacterium]
MAKSPEAFRTISEVADWLGVPTHVLRFWESRFTQIKPVKRAGGRRYYRPTDMALIGGIKRLLHDEGMTIRGAQKLLREKGVKHVAALAQPLDGPADVSAPDVIDATAVEVSEALATPAEPENDAPEHAAQLEREALEDEELPTSDAPGEPTEEDEEIAKPEVEPAQATIIPPTPEVPDTDPDDGDTAFAGTPGVAARLRVANRDYLRRNRDALRSLKDRLETRASA